MKKYGLGITLLLFDVVFGNASQQSTELRRVRVSKGFNQPGHACVRCKGQTSVIKGLQAPGQVMTCLLCGGLKTGLDLFLAFNVA